MKKILLGLLLISGSAQANIFQDISDLCEATGMYAANIAFAYSIGESASYLYAADKSALNSLIVEYVVENNPVPEEAMYVFKQTCYEVPAYIAIAATTDK